MLAELTRAEIQKLHREKAEASMTDA